MNLEFIQSIGGPIFIPVLNTKMQGEQLTYHVNMSQFLGFCFCVSLGTCLLKIALSLVILVKTNDKRCESPLSSMLRLLWDQLRF